MNATAVQEAARNPEAISVSRAVGEWAKGEFIQMKGNEEDLTQQGQEAFTTAEAIIFKERARMCRNMANQLKFSRQGFEDGICRRVKNPPFADPGKVIYERAYERGMSARRKLDREEQTVEKALYAEELLQAISGHRS